jgi:quinol monooxygenase YgiN
MVTKGLLVRLEVRSGMDAEVEKFLQSAVPLVQREIGTTAWFAIRFGTGEYGIFDVFPDDHARSDHLSGEIAKALMARANDLFGAPVKIEKINVLAHKLPIGVPFQNTKGLLLTFKAKEAHVVDVEKFLLDAQRLVEAEPGTTAWFAIRRENGDYGIFDVFPDNPARLSHLSGQLPRELAKHALTLLGSTPDIKLLDIQAEKVGDSVPVGF